MTFGRVKHNSFLAICLAFVCCSESVDCVSRSFVNVILGVKIFMYIWFNFVYTVYVVTT